MSSKMKCSLCGIGLGEPFENRLVTLDGMTMCPPCRADIMRWGYASLSEGDTSGKIPVLVWDGQHLRHLRVPRKVLWALWQRGSRVPAAEAARVLLGSVPPQAVVN